MSDDLIVHDFLRDTLVSTYKECIYRKSRTQYTCVKCGYCYSCHWKKEELDRAQIEALATTANSAILGEIFTGVYYNKNNRTITNSIVPTTTTTTARKGY
jgi:hypothetical protein